MVAPHEGPIGEAEMDNLKAEEQALQQRLEREESKHRYRKSQTSAFRRGYPSDKDSHPNSSLVLHLKESGAGSSEQNVCIICRETFTIGVLTVCGHQFCKECLMLWFKTHHNCPVCKRRLQMSNLHDITLKPQAMKVHQETVAGSSSRSPQKGRSSRTSAIYSEFSAEKLDEIKSIDLPGPSFTTKVDTLVRHLLWLRESDPGAKSIVFSQYADFLSILTHAFSRHRIGYASFDRPNGIARFKDDPAVECFLLHARAHSSGLNLVNASHVFLCEPLLNTAIELQAIARVDRIGQRHETTVWLYIVDGTVEESIYNLSVARRMEHMGQLRQQPMSNGKNAAGPSSASSDSEELSDLRLEAANTDELERSQLFSTLMSADRSLGERVHQNDLWSCLFGHVDRERIRRAENNERLVENPEVRRYLAAEAAERRASSARKHGEGAGRV